MGIYKLQTEPQLKEKLFENIKYFKECLKENGFEISVSKTIHVPLKNLYQSWLNDNTRTIWLGKENIVFRKTTENKSARVTWSDQITSLSVDFYDKGINKSQVVVQHQVATGCAYPKIPDAAVVCILKRQSDVFLEYF